MKYTLIVAGKILQTFYMISPFLGKLNVAFSVLHNIDCKERQT